MDRAWQLGLRAVYPVLQLWWRIRQRPHRGALAALSVGATVLLVRASYRPGWTLPGGGVEPGEAPADAARRELREELGLQVPLGLDPVVVEGRWEGRPETVYVFEAALPAAPAVQVDRREVVEARFFRPEELARLRLSGPAHAFLRRRGWLASAAEHQHP